MTQCQTLTLTYAFESIENKTSSVVQHQTEKKVVYHNYVLKVMF